MLQKLPINALRRAGTAVAMVSAIAAASTSMAPTASAATVGCPATPSFDSTVPLPAGPPALVGFPDLDGLHDIAVAVVGSDNQYYTYDARFGLDSDEVGPLACLGGRGFDQPAPALQDQVRQQFVLGGDHSVWERDVLVGDTLTSWTPVPDSSSSSGVDALAAGDRTDIFYVSGDVTKQIIHQWKVGDQWVGKESLGGATDEVPSVTTGADGQIHVWVTGLNHQVYVNSGSTNAWSGWHSLGGATLHAPAAAVGYGTTTAREDVFVTGTNGFLYQATVTNLGGFDGFHRRSVFLGGPDARLAAATQGTGHMVVMWSSAGQTAATQYLASNPGWLDPFIPAYLCADCVPPPAPATSGTTVSPKTSQPSLTEHRSAPHRH